MLSIIYKKIFKVRLVWSGSCGGLYRHWLANLLLEVDNGLEEEHCLHQPTQRISRSPPTSDRTSDYQEDIVVFKHVDKSAVEALTRLDIHYLHSDVSQNNPLLQLLVKKSFAVTPQIRSNIGFLANNFLVDKLIGLPAQDHSTIHQSLYETQLAIKSTLSSPEKEKFSRLPTFHVLQDNGKILILALVFGDHWRILVKVDSDVPLPFLRRTPIYVDVSTPGTQKLIDMVELS